MEQGPKADHPPSTTADNEGKPGTFRPLACMSFFDAANASLDPLSSKIIEPARTFEHAILRAPLSDSLFVHSAKKPALLLPTTLLKSPAITISTVAGASVGGGCVVGASVGGGCVVGASVGGGCVVGASVGGGWVVGASVGGDCVVGASVGGGWVATAVSE